MKTPTVANLKRALKIAEQIETLEAELASLMSGSPAAAKGVKEPKAPKPKKTRRAMSPEAREKIAAAQKKRWAKQKRAEKKEA